MPKPVSWTACDTDVNLPHAACILHVAGTPSACDHGLIIIHAIEHITGRGRGGGGRGSSGRSISDWSSCSLGSVRDGSWLQRLG
jgi:hypothetical protein